MTFAGRLLKATRRPNRIWEYRELQATALALAEYHLT